MTQHALLSPSSAHRWLACPASVGASQGIPDTSSVHAAEGSAAHELAAQCLGDTLPMEPAPLVGQQASNGVTFTAEMAGYVGDYVEFVRGWARGGALMVEQALDLAAITGEAGAQGTADAVIVAGSRLHVIDLKYGRGVRVDAERNPQLILYALAALDTLDPLGEVTDVMLTIHQPRLEHVSSWEATADELRALLPRIRAAAHRALTLTVTPPGPADSMSYSKAKRFELVMRGRSPPGRSPPNVPAAAEGLVDATAAEEPVAPGAMRAALAPTSIPGPAAAAPGATDVQLWPAGAEGAGGAFVE